MLDELPAENAYRILESGPVVLVSTRGADDRANLMTMGFHMMIQHDPPLVGMVVGPWDYSHQALSETGECVLAVATVDLAEMVVGIGNCSGDALDKFAHFGLTPASAHTVGAPLVRECWANLECRVADDGWARRYNLWVLEVQRIWIDPEREETRLIHHQGDGRFSVDGDRLDLGERMTNWRYLMR
ncbi:flavin reductase family protein [Pseudomonas aeruginosa]|uniref:flavin reductase family protein n=1 Tax=Pseudomonas aeruginosa TaxID=287 RepID=UPI00117AD62B|nr:flavin reductase family protein [Pseudomonas aeruginosa]MCT0805255.1 flavin reductase family protein [Pseudomonas aeruginosa]MCT0861926.1 flavin reductase family protein [Pseudomonas aeruginosa]MCT0873571.1 flavin reductase family protein [Pseudomonas aeruginosa]MCT0904761.1 flavin reductase family protein [Pseudomonas aeruginosa]MCT0928493.1 flavin reductase family protein [Pseudomonas aeruginosa]